MENYNTNQISNILETEENVIIDFGASWCGPCVAFAPIFESASQDSQFKDKVKFVKIDVDNESELSLKYGIRSVPTIIFFKNGTVKNKKIGAMSKSDFQSFIENNI